MEETKKLAIPDGNEFDRVENGEVILKKKEEDVVRIVGARELLEHMDDDDIISYVNDTGIMETQEDRP